MAYVNEKEEINVLIKKIEEFRKEIKELGLTEEEVDTESEEEGDTESEEEVDTESEEEEVDTESEEEAARKFLTEVGMGAKVLMSSEMDAERKLKQEKIFLDAKNYYEKNIIFVKLAFNNLFSYLKRKGQIKKCDAEEFLKSENTEEFQNQKMRIQNSLKEDLFTISNNFDFTQKFFETYVWKQLGLF